MSSNLLKRNPFYGTQAEPEKRIIDTNEIVARRLEALAEIMKCSVEKGQSQGFVQGIDAKEVSLLTAEDGAESGNVIKSAVAEDEKQIVMQAQNEATELINAAKQQADTIVREALEQAERSKKNVLEEARMNGYREGINRANKETEQLKAEYAAKAKALETDYQSQLEHMEADLVEVITGVYEHIFQTELSSQREILVHLISNTMRKCEGSHSFIVHVSKEDYPFVSMQKKQLAAGINSSVEIIEDMTMAKAGCLIEADGGIFDCGLGTQLEELRRKLLLLSYTN